MKKGTKVEWLTNSGVRGSGTVINDEEDGHVLVCVDGPFGEEHHVIWCTVTWLTAK